MISLIIWTNCVYDLANSWFVINRNQILRLKEIKTPFYCTFVCVCVCIKPKMKTNCRNISSIIISCFSLFFTLSSKTIGNDLNKWILISFELYWVGSLNGDFRLRRFLEKCLKKKSFFGVHDPKKSSSHRTTFHTFDFKTEN